MGARLPATGNRANRVDKTVMKSLHQTGDCKALYQRKQITSGRYNFDEIQYAGEDRVLP